jgi:hypothetical protein
MRCHPAILGRKNRADSRRLPPLKAKFRSGMLSDFLTFHTLNPSETPDKLTNHPRYRVPNRTTNWPHPLKRRRTNSLSSSRYCTTHRRHLRSTPRSQALCTRILKHSFTANSHRSFLLMRRKAISPQLDLTLHCTHDRLLWSCRTSTTID